VWGILADIDRWPTWNADVRAAKLEGTLKVGSVFRWKAGGTSLTSVLQSVDPPSEIGWSGTTMSIKALHVFRLSPEDGGTHVRSEESWEGAIARLLKGYSRKTLKKGIASFLRSLKSEAERREE
jgi:hypothetical protein